MAHGQNLSMRSHVAGREYWNKRGLFNSVNFNMPVSRNAGINKKTKRYVNKRERQQVKKYLDNEKVNYCYDLIGKNIDIIV